MESKSSFFNQQRWSQAMLEQAESMRENYIQQSAYLQSQQNAPMSFIPRELADDGFEPIQGEPKGAKYIISYMFKKPKDPVIFVKDKKQMEILVNDLLHDDKVDHASIIVSRIAEQFKPKTSFIKKLLKVESIEYKKI
jgi:hypothetical protein